MCAVKDPLQIKAQLSKDKFKYRPTTPPINEQFMTTMSNQSFNYATKTSISSNIMTACTSSCLCASFWLSRAAYRPIMNDSSGSPERADLPEPTWIQHEAHPASRANADPGRITPAWSKPKRQVLVRWDRPLSSVDKIFIPHVVLFFSSQCKSRRPRTDVAALWPDWRPESETPVTRPVILFLRHFRFFFFFAASSHASTCSKIAAVVITVLSFNIMHFPCSITLLFLLILFIPSKWFSYMVSWVSYWVNNDDSLRMYSLVGISKISAWTF